MKEILSFYIGQAGVQTGSSVWELFCAEHNIAYDGKLMDSHTQYENLETLFHETSVNSWVPRSLFVDLEPNVIGEIRNGSYKRLFHPDRLLNGLEDAANNFSRGFFTVGKLLLGAINTQFRHLIEQCNLTQGIFIMRSLGGGTGAGLTSAMFESFDEYPKTPKIEIPIYPSPTLSTSMVEPYNCLLGEHFCMEDLDVGLLLDNEALFDICSNCMSITHPTYNTINRLIAQIVSSITASVRFENVLNCDLTVLQTNLVPYPRIHFPLCNFAPFMSEERATHQELSVQELTRLVFERNNQMMKVDHFYGKFMSCALFYRGSICPHHVYMALSEIKRTRTIEFVDWCPTGFKVGINAACPVVVPDSKLAYMKKNVAMLTNTSAIGQAWQRLTHRFYLLYSKRSFVHWFVGEGMEECEFTEALYNISALVKDYEEAGENTHTPNKDNGPILKAVDVPPIEETIINLDDDESSGTMVYDNSGSNSFFNGKYAIKNDYRNEIDYKMPFRKSQVKYSTNAYNSRYRDYNSNYSSSSRSSVIDPKCQPITNDLKYLQLTEATINLKNRLSSTESKDRKYIEIRNDMTSPYSVSNTGSDQMVMDSISPRTLNWIKLTSLNTQSIRKTNADIVTSKLENVHLLRQDRCYTMENRVKHACGLSSTNSNTSNQIVSYPFHASLYKAKESKDSEARPNGIHLCKPRCRCHFNIDRLETTRTLISYKDSQLCMSHETKIFKCPEIQRITPEEHDSPFVLAQCSNNSTRLASYIQFADIPQSESFLNNKPITKRIQRSSTFEPSWHYSIGQYYVNQSPLLCSDNHEKRTLNRNDYKMLGLKKLSGRSYNFINHTEDVSSQRRFISSYSFNHTPIGQSHSNLSSTNRPEPISLDNHNSSDISNRRSQ